MTIIFELDGHYLQAHCQLELSLLTQNLRILPNNRILNLDLCFHAPPARVLPSLWLVHPLLNLLGG
jgi:hypothetical protein